MQEKGNDWIRDLSGLGLHDVPEVGGKNAGTGELYEALSGSEVGVPKGFALTCHAFDYFIDSNQLRKLVDSFLSELNPADPRSLEQVSKGIKSMIEGAPFPVQLLKVICSAYRQHWPHSGTRSDVAVRSSATAEDLPDASFAGQQDSFLNIDGEESLLSSIRSCFASLYNARALRYRAERGIDSSQVKISVGIQEMIRSDLAVSGVLFTLDPESGHRGVILINASYGLGELVVKGEVNPDEYLVHKAMLNQGFNAILKKETGSKELSLIYDPVHPSRTLKISVPPEDRRKLVLTNEEVSTLSKAALKIEAHFSKRHGRPVPVDIEWAKDGMTGGLYVVQARPETGHARVKEVGAGEGRYFIEGTPKVRLTGRSVGGSVRSGRVRVIRSLSEMHKLIPGEILVTEKTDPDWEPVLKRATAIITDRGGRTCHAAIVARELGIPAVVGTLNGTRILNDGEIVSVSTCEGDEGRVYEGEVRFRFESVASDHLLELSRTQVEVILSKPDDAFRCSLLPVDGVGLCRIEFMIASGIGLHPMVVAHPEQVQDESVLKRMRALIPDGMEPRFWFIEELSQQMSMIAGAFYPRPVMIRLSDFKSNEYARLPGGQQWEPLEENPMMGFRGSFRYSHPRYRDGFALECQSILRLRNTMGFKNTRILVPFCRTLEDAGAVIAELARNGLHRGKDGLEIHMMCEVPSNVILMRDFCRYFDGFSIGSNDLTQLILGIDRESAELSALFDERNPAVERMISMAIREARIGGRPIGICGQAPSDYPEFARFLVEEGIHGISLNPDSVQRMKLLILDAEKGIKHERERKSDFARNRPI